MCEGISHNFHVEVRADIVTAAHVTNHMTQKKKKDSQTWTYSVLYYEKVNVIHNLSWHQK